MLSEIFQAITDWPVIVQALFGSALFAAISWAGQRLSAYAAKEYSHRSKKRRIEYLKDQRIKHVAIESGNAQEQILIITGIIYKCARSCVKALIWLVLGFAGSMYISLLGLVGITGALFYLFAALNLVKRIDRNVDSREMIKEMSAEIERLEE